MAVEASLFVHDGFRRVRLDESLSRACYLRTCRRRVDHDPLRWRRGISISTQATAANPRREIQPPRAGNQENSSVPVSACTSDGIFETASTASKMPRIASPAISPLASSVPFSSTAARR